ncbi:sugar ABC transporter ATP-binding protein [Caballeronia novacaledonica]|jgi:ribose transport system ATP-binding protein|uniref:sugar ABC transporter ATP-binding protein n=1 Tax=Caballeronia novacaledonica TaxID=1544861 RepID=UPI001EE28F63|nr:sugar ABC transporter ATP-binding protein [Caballeronia novacaledonica]GJH12653.1 sugar ABC transporter ATP-binding protein [Caballeronia novacaledonica]
MNEPLFTLRGLSKVYPGTTALKSLDLELRKGEVHAIVGENGAGKSTLIKILTGAVQKTTGSLVWDGTPVEFAGPLDALKLGIAAIHQEVVLCPHLSVAANLYLGHEETNFGMMRRRKMLADGRALLKRVGFDIDASRRLGDLTIGQQQLVATARAASGDTRLIIFDEPTAYLTRSETDQLFKLIRELNARGVTIVYISHRMEEILELADRASVMRDGSLISTHQVKGVEAEPLTSRLVKDMVAREVADVHFKAEVPIGEELIRVEGLSGAGFEDISLTVRRGEIVGLYGLIGSGRSEFVETLFGRRKRTAGSVTWCGTPLRIRSERDAVKAGIALLPESRRDQGLCLNLPVRLNLNLASYPSISLGGLLRRGDERKNANAQVKALSIRTSGIEANASSLSGGNQQKIVLGKWLIPGADLFIVDEPTVGVDVGAKSEIYKLFAKLLEEGAGIILISSYLPEVYDLADKLHVFRKGRLAASDVPSATSHEAILAAAIGA